MVTLVKDPIAFIKIGLNSDGLLIILIEFLKLTNNHCA